MRTILSITLFVIFIFKSLYSQEHLSDFEKNWPQWRGPYATGIAPTGNPPVEWDENKNIKWKVKIPGKGHATPAVWGNQIILLTAIPTGEKVEQEESDDQEQSWMSPTNPDRVHNFVVLSVDRNSGKIQWQTTVREELPHSKTHQFGSWASNSPVTDGKNIYAYYGSHGLYCLDMNGTILWERDFGKMEKVMSFGEGSSPVLYKDNLIILRDHQGQSALFLLDTKTGKDIWKVDRDEPSTWVTPFVVEYEGKTQIIVSATNKIRSYDMASGDVLWECSGMTRNVIPMPVIDDGIIYIMSGFRGSALLAIDLSKAKGDITDTEAVIWKYNQDTPYTPSPLLMDDKLYFLKGNRGTLTCLDVRNGKEYFTSQTLEGIQDVFASPVGIQDRIYFPGANGTFSVVKSGSAFEVISTNTLEDGFHASPVIIGNNLYLRGFKHLYCISEE